MSRLLTELVIFFFHVILSYSIFMYSTDECSLFSNVHFWTGVSVFDTIDRYTVMS